MKTLIIVLIAMIFCGCIKTKELLHPKEPVSTNSNTTETNIKVK